MSIYKVINNHYIEMLDYIRDMEKKYQSLDNYFSKLDAQSDLVKHLLDHLCDTTSSINIVFQSNMKFWEEKKKLQSQYKLMFIVMMLLIFVLLFLLFIFKCKEIKLLNGGIIDVIKTLILYLTIFVAFASVFFILMQNVNWIKKLCVGQQEKLNTELTSSINNKINVGYLQYIVQNVTNPNFYQLLLYFGYKKRSMKFKYKVDASLSNITTYDSLYSVFKSELKTCILNFYSNGDGYLNIRQIYILSNPISMLKESNKIMDYYNYICLKHNDKKTSNDEIKALINDVVIKQIQRIVNKNQNIVPSGDSAKNTIIQQNISNAQFKQSLMFLLVGFDYLYMYINAIFDKTQSDFNTISANIMTNIRHIHSFDSNDNAQNNFIIALTTTFQSNYDTKLSTYTNDGIDNNIILSNMFTDLLSYFKGLYYDVFLNMIPGTTYWFPFEKGFIITSKLIPDLNSLSINPKMNPTDFSNALYDKLIVPIEKSFDELVILRAYIIEQISTSLLPYNIDLFKFQQYIVNTLIKTNNQQRDQDTIDMYTQLVTDINTTYMLKKQFKTNNVDPKFIESQDFIKLLDGLSYADFKNGLNTAHYGNIVTEFYNTISNATNSNTYDLNNIYFNSNKNYDLWKKSVWMAIIVIVLFWLYKTVGLVDNYVYMMKDIAIKKRAAVDTKNALSIIAVDHESFNRLQNWMFQLIIPGVVALFIVVLLISFQRKSQAAFTFNTELIDSNTTDLNNLLKDLNTKLSELDSLISLSDVNKKIGIINTIKMDDKTAIFELMKQIIDKFEKCNFIIDAANSKVPFPYTETFMNGFILVITVLIFFYLYGQIKPVDTILKIKKLNEIRERAIYVNSTEFEDIKLEIDYLRSCQDDDMDAVIYTLKTIFFMFIIMFLLFYSMKVMSSTNNFQMGLYNSTYFEKQNCYPQ